MRKFYLSDFLSPLALCLLITAFFFVDQSIDVQANSAAELIVNGDFSDELEGWDGSFTPSEIAPVFDTDSQSAYLEDSTLFQSLIPVPNHAIYEFSFDCRGIGTENNLSYILSDSDFQIGTPIHEINCQADSQIKHRLSLVPDSYEVLYIGDDVYIDNVSLAEATVYKDIDTGLIVNGDFIGTDGWQSLVDDEPIQLISYAGETEVGALASGAKQQNISINKPGKYLFSFVCRDEAETPAQYVFSLKIAQSRNSLEHFQSYDCAQALQQFELVLPTVSNDYELILLAPSNRDGFDAWVDDVSLVLVEEITPEPTSTATETAVPTATETAVPTTPATMTVAPTETLEPTASPTETAVPTASATMTVEPTGTATPTATPEAKETQAPTATAIAINPSTTPSPVALDSSLFMPIIRLGE